MTDGIIDYAEYMDNDHKVYIDVNEDRYKDGRLIPLSFVWENGKRYTIDRVIDVRPAASLKAGGVGVRYTVRVRDREIQIYLEEDGDSYRWFMERNSPQ